ncbi:hypothetical protein [Halapricum salinum]|uniref:DUF7982 domain-containing protein n=1 Tax=Halapricum salinum TaxID=1457250 RepID=A0A4D6HCK5_9EURY|nr:hypothetical protein [Halapricum salinum]QCC51719.1 hypothetical protein DV733_10945 [Halapricum salinum]
MNEHISEESTAESDDEAALRAEIEVLREENRRLRAEYARARQSEYRRAALVLIGAGLLSGLGGVLLTSAQTVLFALGGTGVFVGVLTYYLTPERLQPASVGQAVYRAMARTQTSITAELGLTEERLYVPIDAAGEQSVRLFVPQHTTFDVPDDDALSDAFVLGESDRQRGFATYPTGETLFERFAETKSGSFEGDAESIATQLAGALVEQFEVLDATDVEAQEDRVAVAVSGGSYGPIDSFDHPVPSLLATGLARGLDRPISVSVERSPDRQADALVVCRWDDLESDDA